MTYCQRFIIGMEFVIIYALCLKSLNIQYTKQTKEINKHEKSTY